MPAGVELAVVLVVVAALSAGLTWVYVRWARSQDLLDNPTVRSSHQVPTPTGGGVAFLAVFFAAMLLTDAVGMFEVGNAPAVAALAAPLTLVGIFDDRVHAAWWLRYGIQLGVSVAAVAFFGPLNVPLLGGSSIGTVGAGILSVIGVTAVINAYNFLDGMDGLAATGAALQLAFLGYWLGHAWCWILAASLIGFLIWNWHPAKLFMGDTGSTTIGFLVVVAVLSQDEGADWQWYYPVVAVPLVGDFIYTTIRRWLRGHNVLRPDRCHLYQRLTRAGMKPPPLVAIYALATVVVGALLTTLGAVGVLVSLGLLATLAGVAELVIRRHDVSFSIREPEAR